ncbi:DNA-methyltransferase [Anaeromassilibacillus sp. D41t1_190614_C2]|uniref:DNA-methyltransferase n=1 Tax=Anaeromassilibacillus sp. D41t1_190614_C2 TaxID=2787078 RepID=UPI001FAC368F|nr:site-specific DNA-methyltransferase [Anaeromassilibacillus sp. D41t1_190614_C2]
MKKNMNENFEITVDEMTEIFGDTPVEMSFREVKDGMDSFFGLMGLTVELVNLIRKEDELKKHHRAYLHVREEIAECADEATEVIAGILDSIQEKEHIYRVSGTPSAFDMDEEDEDEDDFVTIPKEKYDSMIEDLLTMAELIDMVSDMRTKDVRTIQEFGKFIPAYAAYRAISEPIAPGTASRLKRGVKGSNKYGEPIPGQAKQQTINLCREHGEITDDMINPLRNKRDVWIINTVPFKGGHYAAYPPKLVETCLLAGCPKGGVVLDPFMGSGTTGMVAKQLDRHYVGIELNPEYKELAEARIGGEI